MKSNTLSSVPQTKTEWVNVMETTLKRKFPIIWKNSNLPYYEAILKTLQDIKQQQVGRRKENLLLDLQADLQARMEQLSKKFDSSSECIGWWRKQLHPDAPERVKQRVKDSEEYYRNLVDLCRLPVRELCSSRDKLQQLIGNMKKMELDTLLEIHMPNLVMKSTQKNKLRGKDLYVFLDLNTLNDIPACRQFIQKSGLRKPYFVYTYYLLEEISFGKFNLEEKSERDRTISLEEIHRKDCKVMETLDREGARLLNLSCHGEPSFPRGTAKEHLQYLQEQDTIPLPSYLDPAVNPVFRDLLQFYKSPDGRKIRNLLKGFRSKSTTLAKTRAFFLEHIKNIEMEERTQSREQLLIDLKSKLTDNILALMVGLEVKKPKSIRGYMMDHEQRRICLESSLPCALLTRDRRSADVFILQASTPSFQASIHYPSDNDEKLKLVSAVLLSKH